MADPVTERTCGMLIVYPEMTTDIECGKPAAYVYKDGEHCCCVECFEPMDNDIKAEYQPLEKGPNEDGPTRRDEWLRARQLRAVIHHISPDFDGDGNQWGEHHHVILSKDMGLSGATAGGDGPTYETALAAALEKLGKP